MSAWSPWAHGSAVRQGASSRYTPSPSMEGTIHAPVSSRYSFAARSLKSKRCSRLRLLLFEIGFAVTLRHVFGVTPLPVIDLCVCMAVLSK